MICLKKTNLEIETHYAENKNIHLFLINILRDVCFYFFILFKFLRDLFFLNKTLGIVKLRKWCLKRTNSCIFLRLVIYNYVQVGEMSIP